MYRCVNCHLPGEGGQQSARLNVLLARFWPLALAQSHAGAAAVLIDEFDACESHDAPNEHPTASEIARGKQPLPLRP